MAQESPARSNAANAGKTEPPSATDSMRTDRRVPTARETLQTLPEIDTSELDFEPHDTIPAPPWLEDDLLPPHKTT